MRCDLVPKLDDYIQSFEVRQNGPLDCARFVNRWVTIVTGVDHIGHLRWSTPAQAATAIRATGAPTLIAAVSKFLTEKPVVFAQLGDLVAFPSNEWPGLGICAGARSIFLSPETGTIRRSTIGCTQAWDVPQGSD